MLMNTFLFLSPFELLMVSILPILSMVLCVYRAGKVNQNRIIWGLSGLFLNFFAVLVIFILPIKEKEQP